MNSPKPSEPEHSSSISELKSRWTQLSDVDRAHAVAAIRRSGASNRQIALGLDLNESNLRRLLKSLDASQEDQNLAQQKQISTNELIRRGQAAKLKRAEQQREMLEIKRTRSAFKGADQICRWIYEQQISGPDGESIIEEVRREFAMRDQDGSLPAIPNKALSPLEELILRCRPEKAFPNDASSVSWYHEWLFRWTYYAFPDPIVRDMALEQALEQQWRR